MLTARQTAPLPGRPAIWPVGELNARATPPAKIRLPNL